MYNIKDIVVGWSKYIVNPNKITEEQMRKMRICSTCDFSVKGKFPIFIEEIEDFKEIEDYVCTACNNCPLSTKIRSDSKCDLNKW